METKSNSSESFFQKITYTDGIYPSFKIEEIEHPNRFYAVPLIGFLIKVIALIPIFIEFIFLTIWLLIVAILINPFVVLFTGKYWGHAYSFIVGYTRLSAKMTAYFYGLTDKYPGFGFQTPANLTLDFPQPQNPGRLYAIPLIGFLIRVILLIPYFIFVNIINQAVVIGVFLLAWAVVLVNGKYPIGIFELARDSIRINYSAQLYILGLSDRYPSFYISMAHDKIKIILIAIAIILSGWNYSQDISNRSEKQDDFSNFQYQYEQQLTPEMQDLMEQSMMQESVQGQSPQEQ